MISIVDISANSKNIDINKAIPKNIFVDIDKILYPYNEILQNINSNKEILQNIDIVILKGDFAK